MNDLEGSMIVDEERKEQVLQALKRYIGRSQRQVVNGFQSLVKQSGSGLEVEDDGSSLTLYIPEISGGFWFLKRTLRPRVNVLGIDYNLDANGTIEGFHESEERYQISREYIQMAYTYLDQLLEELRKR